jgi:hypothetical protein
MNEVALTPAWSARARSSAISLSENRTKIVALRLTVIGTSISLTGRPDEAFALDPAVGPALPGGVDVNTA